MNENIQIITCYTVGGIFLIISLWAHRNPRLKFEHAPGWLADELRRVNGRVAWFGISRAALGSLLTFVILGAIVLLDTSFTNQDWLREIAPSVFLVEAKSPRMKLALAVALLGFCFLFWTAISRSTGLVQDWRSFLISIEKGFAPKKLPKGTLRILQLFCGSTNEHFLKEMKPFCESKKAISLISAWGFWLSTLSDAPEDPHSPKAKRYLVISADMQRITEQFHKRVPLLSPVRSRRYFGSSFSLFILTALAIVLSVLLANFVSDMVMHFESIQALNRKNF